MNNLNVPFTSRQTSFEHILHIGKAGSIMGTPMGNNKMHNFKILLGKRNGYIG